MCVWLWGEGVGNVGSYNTFRSFEYILGLMVIWENISVCIKLSLIDREKEKEDTRDGTVVKQKI